MPNPRPWLFATLVATALSSCASSNGAWIELKGQRYLVEIADDADERARGLMFRDALGADRGMLFVYDREQPAAFWMKNTKIPLDILYFDGQRQLVDMQQRVPPCSLGDRCPSYPSARPALYVLELNAGQADALGLHSGETILLGPGVPSTGTP